MFVQLLEGASWAQQVHGSKCTATGQQRPGGGSMEPCAIAPPPIECLLAMRYSLYGHLGPRV